MKEKEYINEAEIKLLAFVKEKGEYLKIEDMVQIIQECIKAQNEK